MSLMSMLRGKSPEDKEFQSIIQENLPQKKDFKTVSGKTAFSSYEVLCPYNLNNSYEAGIVGTAFDYLARIIIARVINKNKDSAWMNLKALLGLERIKNKIDSKKYAELRKRYVCVLADIIDYIYGEYSTLPKEIFSECSQEEWEAVKLYYDRLGKHDYDSIDTIERLVPEICLYAQLEQLYRTGGRIVGEVDSLFIIPHKTITDDLLSLCNTFKDKFISEGLVDSESIVEFNPQFGIASYACGGADADIYIDGVLYDFKTGKSSGYKWQEISQLVAYYYLNIIAGFVDNSEQMPAQIKDYGITSIAFYRARYGEIEFCNTDLLESDETNDNFERFSKFLLGRLKRITELL